MSVCPRGCGYRNWVHCIVERESAAVPTQPGILLAVFHGDLILIFLARTLMTATLVELVSFRLSNSERCYWLYEAFELYGVPNFFNPYKNEPYIWSGGEKFRVYIPPSLEGSVDPATGSVEEPCLESFTWSTSDSMYTFSYYVIGHTVIAYNKDKLGFEKLRKGDGPQSSRRGFGSTSDRNHSLCIFWRMIARCLYVSAISSRWVKSTASQK